jgi:hypothetical protein
MTRPGRHQRTPHQPGRDTPPLVPQQRQPDWREQIPAGVDPDWYENHLELRDPGFDLFPEYIPPHPFWFEIPPDPGWENTTGPALHRYLTGGRDPRPGRDPEAEP